MFGLSLEEEALLHEKIAWVILLQSAPIFLVLYFVIPGVSLSHTGGVDASLYESSRRCGSYQRRSQ